MLSANDRIYLFRMLASGIPDRIQCSNIKSGKYKLNIPKNIALNNYNFIQFAHPNKYQWLSIDIDDKSNFNSFDDIITYSKYNNIPKPTIIVQTTKGWHIHWYLDEALWKNNKLHMLWRKQILNKLNLFYGGDKHAAGFIFRNPLKHNILFEPNVYCISDFEHIVSLNSLKEELQFKSNLKRNIKKLKKYVDFRKVKVGERNTTLFNYIRTFMFVNFELGLDLFISEALRVNSLFVEPLSKSEVISTVNSAYSFVIKHYNPNFKNKNQIEYNRKLAKYKAYKTFNKAFLNLIENLKNYEFELLKFLRNVYSFRKLAMFLNIDPKTVKKYLQELKRQLILFLQNKAKIIVDIVEYTFSKFLKSNLLTKKFNLNEIGVLRC